MRPIEIKEIRRRLAMSGEEFAELMGMSRSILSKWENERVEPGYLWSCLLGALGYVVTRGTVTEALALKARLVKGKAEHGAAAMYEVILVSFIGEMPVGGE